jgi:hypothetical protein
MGLGCQYCICHHDLNTRIVAEMVGQSESSVVVSYSMTTLQLVVVTEVSAGDSYISKGRQCCTPASLIGLPPNLIVEV